MTYKIVRSNRKSVCLSVTAENDITVRCPLNMREEKIDEFVESKKDWLLKILAENSKKLDANKEITAYEKIYICGNKLPLIISNKNEITDDGVYVTSLKRIKSLFISTYSGVLIDIAEKTANKYGFRVESFNIKAYKRRWGCCDKKGNITFNYFLFMLPPSLQRYVIIHELCHTVHFDHSQEFWKLVASFEPSYKQLRKQLKSFDFLINLY